MGIVQKVSENIITRGPDGERCGRSTTYSYRGWGVDVDVMDDDTLSGGAHAPPSWEDGDDWIIAGSGSGYHDVYLPEGCSELMVLDLICEEIDYRCGDEVPRRTLLAPPKKKRKQREKGGQHAKWATCVKYRDGDRCVRCGSTDRLHAHHVKDWAGHPELRFDVDNGITVCYSCHRAIHAEGRAR